jgi:hypothetical protein
MKRAKHTNFPFHVCSLTTVICREAERSVVTKSCEGNRTSQNGGFSGTRNQSEWQGKGAGRRKTNICRHRKGEPAIITDRAGCIWDRRSCVLCGKSEEMREESGKEHLIAQRCKRRRHVLKVTENNWGEPVLYLRQGNYVVKTISRVATDKTNNLNIIKPDPDGIQSMREQVRGYMNIRWNAESSYIKTQEVGDGHSSEDGRDRITLSEQRAISLNMQLMKHKHQRRML